MAYDDEDEDYYEPDTSGDDDYWEPPEQEEPEFEPPPEPEFEPPPELEEEEPFPLPRPRPSAEEQEADEAENAPPYRVAGPPTPAPKRAKDEDDEGYITDPGLLEQLGTPAKEDDEGYVTDPKLLEQLGTPPSRYVEQEGTPPPKQTWLEWLQSLPESLLGGLERGVSGAAQTGELALNKLLGRETETGTEERPIAAEDIKPSDILTDPTKAIPWLLYGAGRSAPAIAGAVVSGGAGLPGIIAGSGLGEFLADMGPKYRDAVQGGADPDKALTDSLKSAGVSGVGTGLSFGAFGLPGGWLAHLMMQPTLVQPTISGTEKAVQNYLAGKPLTEDLGEAALGGALSGLIPGGGHRAAVEAHRPAARPPEYTGQGAAGRYPLGTPTPELPMPGGGTRDVQRPTEFQQPRLPLEPERDPFRMPEPELPLRTPTGEQGQLPMAGTGRPTPEGRVGRELPPIVDERGNVTRPGTQRGELITPPAPEIPGPGGRIEEQVEMPLVPPTGRQAAPAEPHTTTPDIFPRGDLHYPEKGPQGELPFYRQSGVTPERHGTPGSDAAAGTAQAQPPVQPRPGEPGWLTQARGPEDYGKRPAPGAGGGGVNVGDVDPTLRDAITKPRPAPGEAVPGAAPAPPPGQVGRGPPAHLDERPTGELIQLARQPGLSDFMRTSLANELERRGIRRMPEPAGTVNEPGTVGQQLRNREEMARRATESAMARPPIPQNFPGLPKPGGNITPRGARPITDRPVQRPPIPLPDQSLPQRPRTQTTTTAPPTTGRFFPEPGAPRPAPPRAPEPPPPTPGPVRPAPKTVPHVTPTGKSIPLEVVNRHSLRDILRQNADNRGLIGALTDFIRGKVQTRAGETPVYVVSDKSFYGRGVYQGRPSVGGYFSPMLNHIVVPESVIKGTHKYWPNPSQVLLHEGLHAATYKGLEASPQLKTALSQVMRDVMRALPGKREYGFTNVHEFTTEGYSNPKFQSILRDHILSDKVAADFRRLTGSPVRNAWDAMVQTVRKIIGVPPKATTALEAMMRVSEKAMEVKGGIGRNFPSQVLVERAKPKSFAAAEKLTSEEIRARLAGNIPNVQRAIYRDVLRGRGEKIEAPAAPTAAPKAPTAAAAPKAPTGELPPKAGLAERAKKAGISEARQAVRDRIAPNPSWTDYIPRTLDQAVKLIHRGYEGTWNSNHPMARAVARAERALGRKLETQEDFNRLARSIKGLGGKIETLYREGPFDPETQRIIGPPLEPILRDIMKEGKKSRAEYTEYAVARRAIEQHGKGLKTGIPADAANKTVAELGGKWGKTFADYQRFKSGVLRMGKHLIGEENIAKIEELNKDHVPFYRALDPKSEMGDQFRTGGGLKVKDPIEKFKGSERQIVDPLQSELRNMAMMVDLAEKNEVWRAMERTNRELVKAGKDPLWEPVKSDQPLPMTSEQRTRMTEAGIPPEMHEKMRFLDNKAFAPESEKIRYFENGKEQIRAVGKDIGRVAAGMDRAAWGVVTKVLGAPKRMLTAGATLNPDFPAKNVFRDQWTGFIQHDATLKQMLKGDVYVPFLDAAYSLGRFFKPEIAKQFNEWMRNGGANANLVSFDRKLLSMEPRSVAGKVKDVVIHPWQIPRVALDVLRGASEQLENASRFGGYRRDIKLGRTPGESAFRGRERTVDFQRMGNFVAIRFLSEVIPFFNPQMQGMDRYVRSYKTNPTATFVKTLAAITVPSIALYMFNNRGDPRYEELPMWRKMLFWNLLTDHWRDVSPEQEKKLRVDSGPGWFRKDPATGRTQYNDGTIYSFPKPFIEGQLAGSIPERIMEGWLDKRPDAFNHVIDPLIDAVNPFGIPQFAKPTTEAAMNWSTFLKRPLMSEGTERKPQAQQETRFTTETAKALAGAFRTILGKEPAAQLGSPIIMDNYIRQLTGGLGDYAVKLITDPLLNLAQGKIGSDQPATPERTLADMPIIKGFISRFPTSGAESIQNFYDMRKEAQRDKAGGNTLLDDGKTFADALKAHRDGLEKIHADKKMSPEEKRTALDVGTLLMIETARKGVEYMRKMREGVEAAQERKRQREMAQ